MSFQFIYIINKKSNINKLHYLQSKNDVLWHYPIQNLLCSLIIQCYHFVDSKRYQIRVSFISSFVYVVFPQNIYK